MTTCILDKPKTKFDFSRLLDVWAAPVIPEVQKRIRVTVGQNPLRFECYNSFKTNMIVFFASPDGDNDLGTGQLDREINLWPGDLLIIQMNWSNWLGT